MLTAEEVLFLEVAKPFVAEVLTNDCVHRPLNYKHYSTMLTLCEHSDKQYIPFFENKVMLTDCDERDFLVWFYSTDWEGIRVKNARFVGTGPYTTVLLREDNLAEVL